jgi:hypothetical protein
MLRDIAAAVGGTARAGGLGLLVCLAGPAQALEVDCRRPEVQWSATEPPVNLTHIFCGEINGRGRPTGYHARPGGIDPVDARVVEIEDGPNGLGVYTAQVAVRRPSSGWQAADEKFSSFFPDALTPAQVLELVLAAYRESGDTRDKWRGESGLGFQVEGWLLPDDHPLAGRINTAWPVYVPGGASEAGE